MRQTSNRFHLPYILPGQAQKHVTYNEAVRALDSLLHVSVKSRAVSLPPEAASEGELYLVGTNPEGAFTGYAQTIAAFTDGAWMHYPPIQGLIINIEDEAQCLIWRDTDWTPLTEEVDISALSFDVFGINGTADSYNRLLLNSDASLFNHNGAGHQLKINKAEQGETASLVFQDGYAGRAEMGLVGDDNLSLKVSHDGSEFYTAMVVDAQSASVSFPKTPHLMQPVLFNMFGDGGRFGGKPEPLDVRLPSGFEAPNYVRGFNGASLAQGNKFIDNSNNFGGTRGQMDPAMEELAERFKPSASTSVLRYGTEFYTLSVAAGSGTSGALSVAGVTAYLVLSGLRFPMPARFTLSYWLRVTSGQCFISAHSQTRLLINGVEQAGHAILDGPAQWYHIERVVAYDPNVFVGYEANPYRIYCTPGSTFEFAAPVLFPGNLMTDPAQPTGMVSALTAFI